MSQHERRSRIMAGIDLGAGPDRSAVVLRRDTKLLLLAGGENPATIDRDWINGLNAGRKVDREQLALALDAIATVHGAKIERRDDRPNPGYRGCSIYLRITLNGVGASVSLDNLHGGSLALIHWYNDYGDGGRECRDLTSRFASAVRASSGRSPHKATSCCDDWHALATALDRGLCLAARGEAFETPSAP